MAKGDRYDIEEVAFIGRTFEEYGQIFDFDLERWRKKRVLDCPSGACSFVSVARSRGIEAIGADRLYDRTPAVLARRCTGDIKRTMAALEGVEHLYRWKLYDNVADLRNYRERAAARFLRDYADNGERYVHAELPCLPFPDDTFDLVLSAHFLFLYDDRFSAMFHIETVRELLRVGSEVRLFPLVGFDAERSAHVERILETVRDDGHTIVVCEVPFEFQRGANEMLVIQ